MNRAIPAFLLVLFFFLPAMATGPSVSSEHGKTGTVIFPDGSTFSTTLYDLRYLGHLKAAKKRPFLVLSGRGCDECDASRSIYIHSPSDGPMKGEAGQRRFSYPGRYRSNETGELLEKVRAFIGTCIPGRRDGIAWLMESKDEKGAWQTAFFVAEIVADTVKDGRLPEPKKKLKETLGFVQRGVCKEIERIDGYTEP